MPIIDTGNDTPKIDRYILHITQLNEHEEYYFKTYDEAKTFSDSRPIGTHSIYDPVSTLVYIHNYVISNIPINPPPPEPPLPPGDNGNDTPRINRYILKIITWTSVVHFEEQFFITYNEAVAYSQAHPTGNHKIYSPDAELVYSYNYGAGGGESYA